jgi:hypothetical protein
MNRNLIRAVLFSLLVFIVFPVQADDARHPHHIGVAFGEAGHGSETSSYLGLDYSYRFKNNLVLFLFAEDVSGVFEVQAYGFGLGKFFDSG